MGSVYLLFKLYYSFLLKEHFKHLEATNALRNISGVNHINNIFSAKWVSCQHSARVTRLLMEGQPTDIEDICEYRHTLFSTSQ
jgi:hypothetical protein